MRLVKRAITLRNRGHISRATMALRRHYVACAVVAVVVLCVVAWLSFSAFRVRTLRPYEEKPVPCDVWDLVFSADERAIGVAGGEGIPLLPQDRLANGRFVGEPRALVLPAAGGEAILDYHRPRGGWYRRIAFLPGERVLLAGVEGNLDIISTADNGVLQKRIRTDRDAPVVAVSADGSQMAVGDSGIALWDMQEMTSVRLLDEELDPAYLTFSHDGSKLAAVVGSIGNERVVVWDTSTGEVVVPTTGYANDNGPSDIGLRRAVFMPGGDTLVTAGQSLKLWDIHTGEETACLWEADRDRHEPGLRELSVSPDGRFLAAVAGDGVAWLWDLDTREKVGRIAPPEGIGAIRFWSDGIAVGGAHRILFYHMPGSE